MITEKLCKKHPQTLILIDAKTCDACNREAKCFIFANKSDRLVICKDCLKKLAEEIPDSVDTWTIRNET